jgi:hypothetical protein
MRPSSLWVHWVFNEFGIFYYGETSQPLSEQGPVAMDSELVH